MTPPEPVFSALAEEIQAACRDCTYPFELPPRLNTLLARLGLAETCTYTTHPSYNGGRLHLSVTLYDRDHALLLHLK